MPAKGFPRKKSQAKAAYRFWARTAFKAAPAAPTAVCAWPWQVRLQEFAARLYEIGLVPFGATTLMSKFTMRSPEMLAELDPMPCALWHVEQENPSLMWRACSLKLVLDTSRAKSWHLAHSE